MAYQSNLMGDFWRNYRQRRVGAGNALSQNEIGGLLTPMLDNNARMAQEAGQRDLQRSQFDRQMSLQERAQKSQNTAAIVGGVGQLAQLPMAYSSAKNLGWFGSKPPAPVSPTAPNLMAANPTATTAQGTVAPAVAGTTAQAATVGGTEAASLAAYDAAMAEGAAAGVGSTAGTTAGLLSTTGTVSGPAGAAGTVGAYLGGALGRGVARKTGMHEKTAGDVGGVLGGAAAGALAGAAATSWSGPGMAIGGLIGGAIGAVSALF